MSFWPSFFNPMWGLLALGLIPPLVILYFLKLKREQKEIPSLVLWQQVLDDHRVNAPFQRFRRNILLWLQLLVLMLLIFALMQPFSRGDDDFASYVPILIDNSASMGASNVKGGPTRLELVKRRIREKVLDDLADNTQVCLVTVSDKATLNTAFTNNKRELLRGLEKITVKEVKSNFEDGMRLCKNLGRQADFNRVIVASDFNFDERVKFSLPFEISKINVSKDVTNMGITALNARRNEHGMWDVFIRVESNSSTLMGAKIEMTGDGDLVSENIKVSQENVYKVSFKVGVEDKAKRLRFRIVPHKNEFDALATDNIAYITLKPLRDLKIYVSPGLVSFQRAIRFIKGVDASSSDRDVEYDLVISNDKKDILELEARTRLFVSVIPDDIKNILSMNDEGTMVVDWMKDSPLLEHIVLTDLLLGDNPVMDESARIDDFGDRFYEILVDGQNGPLVLKKQIDDRVDYFLMFDPQNSDLTRYRLAFPIMVYNLTQVAMGSSGLDVVNPSSTGVLSPINQLANASEYKVKFPDKTSRVEKTNDSGVLRGVPADHVGLYEISGKDKTFTVGVSLFDAKESSLVSVKKIRFKENVVSAEDSKPQVNQSYWPMLALVGICVFLTEWWFYQRRPGGYDAV